MRDYRENRKGAVVDIANPGNNPGAAYYGIFDVLVVYETNGYPKASALQGFGTQQIGFIATGVPYNAANIASLSSFVQWLDVTDDPATYMVLPTYFAQEVALLDTGVVPPPPTSPTKKRRPKQRYLPTK